MLALPALVTVAVVAVLGGACTSTATRAADRAAAQQQGSSTSITPAAAGPPAITIKNFKFGPDPLKAKAGAVIQITNRDDTAHTVTADAGAAQMFDTKNVAGGATATITIQAAGTYKYHCDIHNYMTGVIQVAP
jgi:plastocyanin